VRHCWGFELATFSKATHRRSDCPVLLNQENYLFNLYSKQHGPVEVKLVYNAMESFQLNSHQFCWGLLKIFSIEKKMKGRVVRTLHFFYSRPRVSNVLEEVKCSVSQTYNKRHKIQHTRVQTRLHEGTSEEKETTFRNDVFLRHFIEVKKSHVTYASLKNTCVEYNLGFNHRHFLTPPNPKGFCGTFFGELSAAL
jgi:hypothetical protein